MRWVGLIGLLLVGCGVPKADLLVLQTNPPVCSNPAPKAAKSLVLDRLQVEPGLTPKTYFLVGCLTNFTPQSLTSTFGTLNGLVVDNSQTVRLTVNYFEKKKITAITGGIKFPEALSGQAVPFKLQLPLSEAMITGQLNLVKLQWNDKSEDTPQSIVVEVANSPTPTSDPAGCSLTPISTGLPVGVSKVKFWQDFDSSLYLVGCLSNYTSEPISRAQAILLPIPDTLVNRIPAGRQAILQMAPVNPQETTTFRIPLWDTKTPQINMTQLTWQGLTSDKQQESFVLPIARY